MNTKYTKQKWKRWLNKDLLPEIRYLMTLKIVFKKMAEIFVNSQECPKSSYFYWYIGQVHSASIVAGIYRLIDQRPDIVSLYRLLNEIKNNPELVSRRAYTRLTRKTPNHSSEKNILDAEFTERVGRGEYMNPTIVEIDIRRIERLTKKMEKFRHKFIGHHANNQRRYKAMPTFKQAHDCIDELESIFQNYYVVITGTHFEAISTAEIQGIEDDISSFFEILGIDTRKMRKENNNK